MTQLLTERTAVSVDELKRAWAAVQAGQFRPNTVCAAKAPHYDARGATEATEWAGASLVLPVLGCGGASGATTMALALAAAIDAPARVVECASLTASGLAAASTAELGVTGSWIRGTRDQVLIERVGDVVTTLQDVPTPLRASNEVTATVLDVGWEIGQVLASPGWMDEVVRSADPVVLTATATIPGLRQLEVALDLLRETPVVAAVRGTPRRRWPKVVQHSTGPLTQSLDREDRLICVPLDSSLGVQGLTGKPLPKPLLEAAAGLLRLMPDTATKGTS